MGGYNSRICDKTGILLEPAPQRLALLKHYRSLMPMAQEARKPMFMLKPADGAIGAHVEAVRSCYEDFLHLARVIGAIAEIEVA